VSISTPPPFELDELATARGVAAPVIAAQPANGLHVAADQPIRERRLADTRRADEADRAAGAMCARSSSSPSPTRRSRARGGRRIAARPIASSSGARSASRSTLFSTNHRLGARVPDRAHVALEPPLVGSSRFTDVTTKNTSTFTAMSWPSASVPAARRISVVRRSKTCWIDAAVGPSMTATSRRRPGARVCQRFHEPAGQVAERRAAARKVEAALAFRDDARGHAVRAVEARELLREEVVEAEGDERPSIGGSGLGIA